MILRLRTYAQPACGTVTTVVVGAGHAGLAMSRCLAERSIDHVVLERGEVANAWRHERWHSLRLLTPNWQTKLPGHRYTGADPDGFMTAREVIEFVETYAGLTSPPIRTGTTVLSVRPDADGYRVITNRGDWRCRTLVIASGASSIPLVPAVSPAVPSPIATYTPLQYRNPSQLDEGGVLVVGASASGLQLADEIHRSGRPVTLAVGEHVRMPRVYRGRDILWWMDAVGVLDQRWNEMDDIVRARGVPSPQLTGTPGRATLDLNVLSRMGVRLVSRLVGIRDGKAQFSGALSNYCAMADLKMGRLLDTIDAWARESREAEAVPPPERFAPTQVPRAPCLGLDLASGEIRSIVWATGFRPDHSWLALPVLDRKGTLRHEGGVVDAPGVYAMGLTLMRRRKSSFICGAEDDARELSAHLAAYLDGRRARPAVSAAGF